MVQIMLQNPHSRLPYRNFRIYYCLRGRVQESKCLRYCVTHWQKWTLQTSTRNYSDVHCIWLVNSKLFFCNVHQINVMLCVQYIRQLYQTPVVTLCLVLGSQLSNQHFDFVHLFQHLNAIILGPQYSCVKLQSLLYKSYPILQYLL